MPESMRFLAYLAPRLDGLPLAVLASTRPGEGVVADLARLASAPETTVLRPAPLSVEATAGLCEQRLGAHVGKEFAAACREATGGNPFFLEALLREASEQKRSTGSRDEVDVRRIGPAAVAQAVLLRLSGAPAATTALVRAVAVLGDGAGLAEAARLADVDQDEAAGAADLLAGLAILRPSERLEFAHPIVREAVYADIGSHERAAAHARAAVILGAAGASDERIAAQIMAAKPSGDAERVELLRRVAADALGRGAPAAAVAYLGRALAEPPPAAARAEVLIELGFAELRLATPGAVDHLTAAVGLIREPAVLATPVRLLANTLTMVGEPDRAVEVIESAIEIVEPADGELALLLEAELAAHAQQASREARAPAARRLGLHAELRGATPGERLVLATLAFERARASESAGEAAAYIERALADVRSLGEQELDVTGTFYLLVVGLVATDALDLADAYLEQALSDAHQRGSIPALAFVLAQQARVSMRRGAMARAEADAGTALVLLTAHGIPLGATLALASLTQALIEAGDVEGAEQAVGRAGYGEEIPPGMASNPLLEARGLLRLAQGNASGWIGRSDRVRPPRRAVGRGESTCRTLALARLPRAHRHGGRRGSAPDGARGPRPGAALGSRERHRHRAARGRPDGRRSRVRGSPARIRGGARSLAGAARASARPG